MCGRFLRTQRPIEISVLPEARPLEAAIGVTGAPAEAREARFELGTLIDALKEGVQMIRHEAVRNEFDVVVDDGTQKFASDQANETSRREEGTTPERAHGQEDAHAAGIARVRQARRATVTHDDASAKRVPTSLG